MYYKRSTGAILVRKSTDIPDWVKWVHRSLSENHCEECLKLDGCLFSRNNHPTWPHHPNCHCILEPVSYAIVAAKAVADSAYSKFDPYLFNTTGAYKHGKKHYLSCGAIQLMIFLG